MEPNTSPREKLYILVDLTIPEQFAPERGNELNRPQQRKILWDGLFSNLSLTYALNYLF